jgi:hypothetical protein
VVELIEDIIPDTFRTDGSRQASPVQLLMAEQKRHSSCVGDAWTCQVEPTPSKPGCDWIQHLPLPTKVMTIHFIVLLYDIINLILILIHWSTAGFI